MAIFSEFDYQNEMRRRGREGSFADTVKAESEVLLAWFRQHHPDRDAPTAGTIENNIRREFRILKSTK